MTCMTNRFGPSIDPRDIDPEMIARLVAKGRRERSRAVHDAFSRLFRRKERTEPQSPLPGHAAPC